MKKLFKKLKDSKAIKKVIKPVVETAVGFIPGGRPVLDIVTSTASALWEDKNGDGKVQLKEIKWGPVAAVAGIIALVKFGVFTPDELRELAEFSINILNMIAG